MSRQSPTTVRVTYPNKTKRCGACRVTLPWRAFRVKAHRDGVVTRVLANCAECQRAHDREAYRAHDREAYRARHGGGPAVLATNTGPRLPTKPLRDFLAVRFSRGDSQYDIEDATGVSMRRIYSILSGECEHVTLDTADRLLLPYGYSVTAIYGREEYQALLNEGEAPASAGDDLAAAA